MRAHQARLDALAAEAAHPLFLIEQLAVVQRNMDGEPLLPSDDDMASLELP